MLIEKFSYNMEKFSVTRRAKRRELTCVVIILKLGLVTGERTVRFVILRKRRHGGLTIAGMLRHRQTNTAPCKRRGRHRSMET